MVTAKPSKLITAEKPSQHHCKPLAIILNQTYIYDSMTKMTLNKDQSVHHGVVVHFVISFGYRHN